MRHLVKSDAEECYGTARQNYDRFKPVLTCDVGKLYVRLAKARCKLQAGVYRGNQTGKKMYEDAVQEEEGLLKDILAAVKADGSCVKFERIPGETDDIKSADELAISFHRSLGIERTMDEEEIAENVRFAELWYQLECAHNERDTLALNGYWTEPKKDKKKGKKDRA